jgi:D-glycero-D-manno-heptose 1,7-bisphosphate phosphatase
MRRALILDRDGVINVETNYVGSREKFTFTLGIFPFLREAQNLGYRLAIVTNQSGVARGLYTKGDYDDLTRWMLDAFRQEGIVIDLVLACFEYKDGTVEVFKRESFWRKPNPGMILEAAQRLGLDLGRSAFLGDQKRDMQAALQAGVGRCLLLSKETHGNELAGVTVVPDFAQALQELT